MQTCKYLSAICAAALLSGAISLRADETEAQAKAREALRQKMAELDAQEQTKPVTPAPVTEPKPAPAPPPVVKTPPPPVVAPTPPPPVVVKGPPAPAPTPVVVAPVQPAPAEVPVVVQEDPEAQARAHAALRKKMAELDAQESAGTQVGSTPTVSKPTPQNVAAVLPPSQPIAPPPSPISTTKEGRLAVLLQQYKADTISPEQYHTQRAAILAEQ